MSRGNNLEITAERIRNDEYSTYRELFKQVFHKEFPVGEFQWKYLQTPFYDEPFIYVAKNEQGEMIGARSFFPTEVVAEGKKIKALQAGDTMVRKDDRGKGLFKELTLKGMEDVKDLGYEVIFNFPNEHSYPGYLKLGWTSVASIDQYHRILSFRGILIKKLRIRTLGKLISAVADPVYRLLKPVSSKKKAGASICELEILDAFSDREMDFMEKQLSKRVHQVKSRPYLQWRYTKSPRGPYEFLCYRCSDNNEVKGIAVTKTVSRGEHQVIDILEWISIDETGEGFLGDVLTYYRERGCQTVKVWCVGDQPVFRKQLEKMGFLRRSTTLHFVVKSLVSENHQKAMAKGPWHLHKGDGDTA